MMIKQPPLKELVNVLEVEAAARQALPPALYEEIAGGDRSAFDRMTFRPRLMVNTMKLDLSLELFGEKLFAPILVGPVGGLKRFHPDGEVEMARGAAAGRAVMALAGGTVAEVAKAKASLWVQVNPEEGLDGARARALEAMKAGCKAICVNGVGDRAALAGLQKEIAIPIVVKGVMTPDDARMALDVGVKGIVVSNYRAQGTVGLAAPIEVLPGVVDAVGGRVPVLVDGGFRRGTDVLKALAMGARAVFLARPAVWGLAAYGAAGVQYVLELVRGELARAMAMCGKANLGELDRSLVRVHRW